MDVNTKQRGVLRDVSMIRKGPPLTDIAGNLRAIADDIERGDFVSEEKNSGIRAAYLVLMHDERFEPAVYMYGHIGLRHELAGIFTHCAHLAIQDRDDSDE